MIFGIGSYFRRSASIVDGEDVVRSGKPKANLKPAALSENNSSSAANGFSQPNSPDLLVNDNRQINEQPKREKTTSDETVYFCGAITKKGTPCTRRVKTKGFCWQHAKSGQVAPARF
ncbi:MAG: DUF5763 domain-containing protein [Pyrinomonadaceae bacterium]